MAIEPQDTVNFFSELPPELVLQIIVKLDVEDVFNCLHVNRDWYNLLSELEPFWRKACVSFGLFEHVIEKLRPNYSSSKDMLLATRRHRKLITSTPPTCSSLTEGYPFNVHYVCKYAKGDTLIGTLYKDFKPREIVVKKVRHTLVERTLTIYPVFSKCAENRIVWMHLHTDLMFCASASGLWSVYSLQNGQTVFQWRGESLYDYEIKIGGCDKCLVVAIAKLIVMHNEETYWELKVVKIAHNRQTEPQKRKTVHSFSPTVAKFKIRPQNEDITVRRAAFGKKKISLLPSSRESSTTSGEFCSSHTIFLQWGHIIVAHDLMCNDKGAIFISRTPSLVFDMSFNQDLLDNAIIKRHGLNTEFTLSENNDVDDKNQLLGVIFQSHLIVWNVKTMEQLSLVEIELEQYEYEEMKLLSLGQIYSIIGLEFTNTLLVVVNGTGQVVLKYSGFAQKHCRMTPPYIEFLSLVKDRWISDITAPCTTLFPAVTYWNKTNRSVEGIYFGQVCDLRGEEEDVKSKKQSWWQRKWQTG